MPTLKLKALKYYDDKVLDDNWKKKRKVNYAFYLRRKLKKPALMVLAHNLCVKVKTQLMKLTWV